MPIDIKLGKAQINQADLFVICSVVQIKKVITDLAIPLARDDLPELVSNLETSAIHKLKRKISGKRAVRFTNR